MFNASNEMETFIANIYIVLSTVGLGGPCGVGTFHRPGEGDCQPCAPGHSMSAGAHYNQECNRCEAGTYAPNAGSVICEVCEPGRYSNEGASGCDSCSPGSFSGSGASICQKCVPGSYTPHWGSTSCLGCSPGSYSDEGATSCETCSADFYCPDGTNQILCPEGMVSEEGATSCQALLGPGIQGFFSLSQFISSFLFYMKADIDPGIW